MDASLQRAKETHALISYLNNWLSVKKDILTNNSLKKSIVQTIEANFSLGTFPESVFELGSGNNHVVYSLDNILDGGKHLALRLVNARYKRNFSPDFSTYKEVMSELSSFCHAYVGDENPPSFVGVVQKEDIYGLVVEDISKKKSLSLVDTLGGFSKTVLRSDGVKFFIDPQTHYTKAYDSTICDIFLDSRLIL